MESPKVKETRIGIRLTAEMRDELEELQATMKRTMKRDEEVPLSEVVRAALRRGIRALQEEDDLRVLAEAAEVGLADESWKKPHE